MGSGLEVVSVPELVLEPELEPETPLRLDTKEKTSFDFVSQHD